MVCGTPWPQKVDKHGRLLGEVPIYTPSPERTPSQNTMAQDMHAWNLSTSSKLGY